MGHGMGANWAVLLAAIVSQNLRGGKNRACSFCSGREFKANTCLASPGFERFAANDRYSGYRMGTKAQRGRGPADKEEAARDSVAVMRVTAVSESAPASSVTAGAGAAEGPGLSVMRERPTLSLDEALRADRDVERSPAAQQPRSAAILDSPPGGLYVDSEIDVTQRSEDWLRDGANAELRSSTAFVATLGDIPMPDLLRTVAAGGKTGVVTVHHPRGRSRLWLVRGEVIDAEAALLSGEPAVYRVLAIREGELVAEFEAVRREPTVNKLLQALLMEAAFREDRSTALLAQLGSGGFVRAPEEALSAEDLSPVESQVLALLDAPRLVDDILWAGGVDDLDTLNALLALSERGLVQRGVPVPERAEGIAVVPGLRSEIRELRPAAVTVSMDIRDMPDVRLLLEAGRQRQRRLLMYLAVLAVLIIASLAFAVVGFAELGVSDVSPPSPPTASGAQR